MSPKTVAILGAGDRGMGFGRLIARFPQFAKVVAVAEPRDEYRRAFAAAHDLEQRMVFPDWETFCAQQRLCDAVVISTMDRQHAPAALACLERGYDVLLEKPMAPALPECRAIEQAQRRSGAILAVCHSLRYNKAFSKVRELLAAGAVGRIITLDLLEQVIYWHQVHSFVRGKWAREADSSFMLLAKSCHDLDYICFLVGKPCLRVSSFGELSWFRRENAPPGSTERCTDPCPLEPACAYSAVRMYVDADREGWPASVVSLDHSREAHLRAIREGPYGRCAWKCDNDVVDHQVVAMQFADDITATFTMTAFTQQGGRRLRVHGTEGELSFDESSITVRTFADGNVQHISIGAEGGGHGGGDLRVVRNWLLALHTRDERTILTGAAESLRTHAVVFAAEKSRREGRTVSISEM